MYPRASLLAVLMTVPHFLVANSIIVDCSAPYATGNVAIPTREKAQDTIVFSNGVKLLSRQRESVATGDVYHMLQVLPGASGAAGYRYQAGSSTGNGDNVWGDTAGFPDSIEPLESLLTYDLPAAEPQTIDGKMVGQNKRSSSGQSSYCGHQLDENYNTIVYVSTNQGHMKLQVWDFAFDTSTYVAHEPLDGSPPTIKTCLWLCGLVVRWAVDSADDAAFHTQQTTGAVVPGARARDASRSRNSRHANRSACAAPGQCFDALGRWLRTPGVDRAKNLPPSVRTSGQALLSVSQWVVTLPEP